MSRRLVVTFVAVGALLLVAGIWELGSSGRSSHGADVQTVSHRVSANAIGPVPFGTSPANVRAWKGKPEFRSPPEKAGRYPIPGALHDEQDVVVWGWHCVSTDGSVCHTLIGFRKGKLTSFSSGPSAAYRFASGVSPGMKEEEAQRLEPGSTLKSGPGCSRLIRQTAKGNSLISIIVTSGSGSHTYVYSLYASSGDPAFGPHC